MKRTLTLGLAAGLLAAAAVAAAAAVSADDFHRRGPGDHGARHTEHLALMLDLTEDQRTALQGLHQELESSGRTLAEQHRTQMEEIEALLDRGDADPAELGRKLIAAHATRAQLEALHDSFATRFRELLDERQRAKWDEIRERHGERRGHRHGFGLHGPPGD